MEKEKIELIDELVKEYNAAEAQAFAALKEIFYTLKAGAGMRKIRLSNGVISNCWNSPDRLDYNLYLKIYDRKILEVEKGH